jgi:hypothetical protein
MTDVTELMLLIFENRPIERVGYVWTNYLVNHSESQIARLITMKMLGNEVSDSFTCVVGCHLPSVLTQGARGDAGAPYGAAAKGNVSEHRRRPVGPRANQRNSGCPEEKGCSPSQPKPAAVVCGGMTSKNNWC